MYLHQSPGITNKPANIVAARVEQRREGVFDIFYDMFLAVCMHNSSDPIQYPSPRSRNDACCDTKLTSAEYDLIERSGSKSNGRL